MAKYEKFTFQELSKALVVNAHETYEVDENSNNSDLITDAVTQHLSTIVGDAESNDPLGDLSIAHKTEEEAIVDIEQIRQEHYNKGLDDAKQQYESVIENIKSEENLTELLRQKLNDFMPPLNIDDEIIKLSTEMIANIAKKVYLVLPVNFEQMLKESMLVRLKSAYKEGSVSIRVNPDRYDFCKEILKAEDLPAKLKEHFSIVADENLGKDDCSLEWNDTRLEYNKEQLSFEINQILEQLQQ